MFTSRQLKFRVFDRRHAGIHEGGHYVLGRRAGLRDVAAWIGRIGAGSINEVSWTGQTVFHPSGFNRLSRVRQLMIGVAGAIGERVWSNRFEQNPFCVSDCLYDQGFMSPTEWELCGASPDVWSPKLARAAEQVIDLLMGELRTEWLRAAHMLMCDGVLISPRASRETVDMVMKLRQRAMALATVSEMSD